MCQFLDAETLFLFLRPLYTICTAICIHCCLNHCCQLDVHSKLNFLPHFLLQMSLIQLFSLVPVRIRYCGRASSQALSHYVVRPAVFPHSDGKSIRAGLGASRMDGVEADMGVRPNQASLSECCCFHTVCLWQHPYPTVNPINTNISDMQMTSE